MPLSSNLKTIKYCCDPPSYPEVQCNPALLLVISETARWVGLWGGPVKTRYVVRSLHRLEYVMCTTMFPPNISRKRGSAGATLLRKFQNFAGISQIFNMLLLLAFKCEQCDSSRE